jgi:AAA+ ATPase superfamily predicted ATPase
LSSIGYIGRRFPLTGRRSNPKQVRYVIQDPLLRFWFRFVFPNLSFIQQMGPRRAFRDRIRPEIDAYFGLCFERLCREALPAIYEQEGVSAGFEVGEYWDKTVQIDVVGLRDDNWTDLGECKWGAVRSLKAIRNDLERKVQIYPNNRGATIGKRIFLRYQPGAKGRDISDVKCYGLEDLYVS